MTHPILTKDAKKIRDRMRNFLKESAYSVRNSNILFVCGGNDSADMRLQFREYAKEALGEYKVYFPEFSFENIFLLDGDGTQYIDLNKFEETVANLSFCVILFPEPPGSLVELGLFSGNTNIVESLLVIIDRKYDDGKDDFITLGPVNKINADSKFRSVFVESYENVGFFDKIKNRIEERHKISSKFKKIDFVDNKWSDLSYFEKLSSIHWIIEICRISDVEELRFIAKSIFGNTVKTEDIINISSILIGSNEFKLFGDEKWICTSNEFSPIIRTKSGEESFLIDLKTDISNFYLRYEEFDALVQRAYA